jgi:flavin-dependent dehydrogenase
MGYNPKVDLKAALHKFVYEDKIYSQWFKGGKKISTHTCVVNMFSSIEEPFKDNVIFCGDAAWLMEFSNMGALMSGWSAANAVTVALVDGKINKEGISSYLEFWKKWFYDDYGQRDFKPIDIQDFLNASDIDYLFTLIKEPLVPSLDFFTLFNTIGNTFGELLLVIQEDRPDVFDKLMAVAEGMEEAEREAKEAGFPSL